MSDTEIDIAKLIRDAEAAHGAIEFAKTYERLNYTNLSPVQQEYIERPEFAVALLASNQFGKSFASAVLIAILTLARYPLGWKGWRQPRLTLERQYSIIIWVLSPTTQVAVSGLQPRIFGGHSGIALGTGTIPLRSIARVNTLHGMSGAIESVEVRRDDGTLALIRFKTVAQGRDALQAESVDAIFIDEMFSDGDLLPELLSRISATSGIIRLAATPLKQQSPISLWFKETNHPERVILRGSRDQAIHITKEQNEAFLRSLSDQKDINTRYYGQDWQGGGLIYQTPFSQIVDNMRPEFFGPSFKYLLSTDFSHFGRQGVFAACMFGIDPMTNIAHLFDVIEMEGALAEQHVAAIKNTPIGTAPIAWPGADGFQQQSTGEQLAQVYKRLGLNMLPQPAQFESGGWALEPGIALVDALMATNKLKIAKHLLNGNFGRSLQMYERDENNKPIKWKGDHVLDAMRIGCMSLKHARCLDERQPTGTIERPQPRDWDVFTGEFL